MSDEEGEEVEIGIGEYTGDRNEAKQRHGNGKWVAGNGDTYEGSYVDGLRSGKGRYNWTSADSGVYYEGGYLLNKKHGAGKLVYPDKTVYDGEWAHDLRQGFGTYTYANGDAYHGQWAKGTKTGLGAYFTKATTTELAGNFKDNLFKDGEWRLSDGSRYCGEFSTKGEPVGVGKFVFKNGNQQAGSFSAVVHPGEDDDEGALPTGGEWAPGPAVTAAYSGDLEAMPIVDTRNPKSKYEMGEAVAHEPTERTYAMIKPDAVRNNAADAMIDALKEKGFKVVLEERGTTLTEEQAKGFYAEHAGKGFFDELVGFMTSGPIVKLVLERTDAILGWRALLGPTNTQKAKEEAPASLRARFGTDGTMNAAHGSDSPASAAREIDYMFPVQSTFAYVKSHADDEAKAGVAGTLQQLRVAGFTVTHREDSEMTAEQAEACSCATAPPPTPALAEGEEPPEPTPPVVVTKVIVQGRGAAAALPAIVAVIDAGEAVAAAACSADDAAAAADIEAIFPMQRTYAAIKPDAMEAGSKDAMLALIAEEGFTVAQQEETTLSKEAAQVFYSEHKDKDFYDELTEFMSSGPVTKLVLEKRGAIKAWRALLGPTDSEVAKEEQPTTIRARFGTDGQNNAAHGSDSPASAAREISLMFATPLSAEEAAKPVEQTYAMIKPDAVAAGAVEEIVLRLQNNGFTVVKREEAELEKEAAELFYGEHKEKEFFGGLVEFMTSGPVVKLCLSRANAILGWRAMLGPTNTETAKAEQPTCLRALFGTDGTKNAAHGSDSTESAERELGIMFPPAAPEPEEAAEATEE